MPTVVALLGPTAAGKTEAALRIADAAAVELISVDSAMVYRRMNIGTAKPAPDVLRRYPHALVDIVDPQDAYSVARFVADADTAVRAALAAGRTPLLVGGTMLYFRAFKHGLDALPPADAEIRAEIADRAAVEGWPALHRHLAERDPAAAACIDANNGQRIQRALEVLAITGRSITTHWQQGAVSAVDRLRCTLVEVAIAPPDRADLHRRIDRRLQKMLQRGLLAEVRALRADPALSLALPAMRAVGYAQVWRHLDGDYEHAAMIDRIGAATRQVAKRQLTWLRRWSCATVADGAAAATCILRELRPRGVRVGRIG